MTTIAGVLDAYFETGTEGVIWSVYEDGKTGYDGLNCLHLGDHLTIYDKKDRNNIVWHGNIDFEYDSNKKPYPFNPRCSQQTVAGMWVHGLQVGVDTEKWAKWFIEGYPCEFIAANMGRFYPVTSSLVRAYYYSGHSYNKTDGDLFVQFKNGVIYRYKDVPCVTYEDLYNAASFGKFFTQNIKDKFVTEKVELPKPDWNFIPIMAGGKFPKEKP